MGGRPVSPVSPKACVMPQSFGPSAKAQRASATKSKPAARAAGNLSEEEYARRELRQPGAYVSDYVIHKLQRIIVHYYRAERLLDNRGLISPQELMHPSYHSTPPIQNIFPVIVWMPGHWVFCIADGRNNDLYVFDSLYRKQHLREIEKRMFHLCPRTSSKEGQRWTLKPVHCQQQPLCSNDCAAFALSFLDVYCKLLTEKDIPPPLDDIILAMANSRYIACLPRSAKNPF